MEQVSPHVYIDAMDGPCCIGAIQTEEGVLLVDSPQYPTRAERWLEEIKDLGQIKYLLNTEPHADHVFGNAFVPGTIIAHQYIKDVFWDDAPFGPNFMKTPEVFIEIFDPDRLDVADTYQAREPEITFEGKMNLYLGEVTIEAIPLNGHVSNDTAVYIPEDRVLFATDNVFNEVMTWYHDSLPYDWLETLDYLKSLDAEIVIPGHGKPGGPELFDMMKQVVEDAIGTVQKAIETGVSKAEAMETITFIDRQPVPAEFKSRAPGLQKLFVARLYDEVQRHRSSEGFGGS